MKVLVVDNDGQHVEFARTLANSGEFSQVGYVSNWKSDTPVLQAYAPGAGFDEIAHEFHIFDCLEKYDAVAVPGLYNDDLQRYTRAHGIPTWGSGDAEMLERDRLMLLELMEDYGLEVPKYHVMTLDGARDHAEDGDVLKFSALRGDTETVSINGDDLAWYFDLGKKWGPMRNAVPVIHEKPLKKSAEIGFDGIYVRGQLIGPMSIGYEVKDGGYIEKNIIVSDLPEQLYPIFVATQDMLGTDYSNFMSTEVMSGVMLDITTRFPQPPGDLKLYNWKGLPRIIKQHLSGKGVTAETEPAGKYGVQLIAHNNEPKEFVRFGKLPAHLRGHVFINRPYRAKNGDLWSLPWIDRSVSDWADAASVCASGRTVEQAIDEAKRLAKDMPLPHNVVIDPVVPDQLMKAIEDGEKEGYKF